jgi:arylsulfatase
MVPELLLDEALPKSAATIGEVLRQNGYHTAFFGKHHNVPARESGPTGPFDRWPTGLGFDYFYGFISGYTNQWAPALYRGTTPVQLPADRTLLDEALADDAISWVRQHRALTPQRPFFVYYAPGTAHSPHHAPKEWIAKFKGAFDQGWDEMRKQTFARQKAAGIIPANTQLTARPKQIPAWNTLSAERKELAARFMEVYAAQLSYADYQIGRVLDAIQDSGAMDHTLILFIQGDNGGSPEGLVDGTFNETRAYYGNDLAESADSMHSRIDLLGGPKSLENYPVGWAWATDAPFQWVKAFASHLGGIRNGLVVTWPERIDGHGEVRSQFHHVVDVMPTVLEAAGISVPAVVNGIEQQPMAGISMLRSFTDPAAPGRATQFFVSSYHRGIYSDGWFAGTTPKGIWGVPGIRIDADEQSIPWELYEISNDFSQARNLAAKYPQKLQELKSLWLREAEANGALNVPKKVALLQDGRTSFVFHAGDIRIPERVAPTLVNRSFTIAADTTIPADGAEGVLATVGGRFAGWSFLVRDNKPMLVSALSEEAQDIVRLVSNTSLRPGPAKILYQFDYDGGSPGAGGIASIHVDGTKVAESRIARTPRGFFSIDETFDVGDDTGTAVGDAYPIPFKFNGELRSLTITLR